MQISIHVGNKGLSEHKTWKIWVQSARQFSIISLKKAKN